VAQDDATGWLGAYDDPGVPSESPPTPPADPELVTDCYEPDVAADLDDELATWFSTRDAAAPGPVTVEPEPAVDPEPVIGAELVAEPLPVALSAEPAPAEEAEPVAVTPAAPAPKVPLHRRELHLPRRRPRRERRGGGRGGDVVGLRVGSSQIAAARVHVNGGFELVQLARTPLEPGVVVGGEVREPDLLAAALKSFFAEHKLPRRNVRLGVASSRIGVRVLEVPPLDDPRQLENAIRFRAHEEIPIPVAEAVLDHVVVGDATDGDGNTVRRILVAFAHRDLVLRQVEACRRAGLRPLGVDLDAFALLRAVTSSEDSNGGTRALVAVAVGHERTILAVSDGEVCEFTRVLEWGGGTLDVALANALDLSPSQANAVKHRLSLHGDGEVLGLTPLQVEAARNAARLELQNLAREIVSSLRYYQTRPGALDLGEILVTGGASQLPGALAELASAIGAPVRAGDPLGRVTLGKKVKRPADAGSYAIAVGLGLDR
jgi:type IV pilus assembly protein PilM